MKRALCALAMAPVSVPLTFAKTNNQATRRWTPSSRQATFEIQTQRKEAGGAAQRASRTLRHPTMPAKSQGFEE